MKIIDEYTTPDGRHEYRVEDDDGNILPPMSFPEMQTENKLKSVVNKINEDKSKNQPVEMVTIPKTEYEDLKSKSESNQESVKVVK